VVEASVALKRQSAKIKALQLELNGITEQYRHLQSAPGGVLSLSCRDNDDGRERQKRRDNDDGREKAACVWKEEKEQEHGHREGQGWKQGRGQEQEQEQQRNYSGHREGSCSPELTRDIWQPEFEIENERNAHGRTKDTYAEDRAGAEDRKVIVVKEKTAGSGAIPLIDIPPHLARERELAFIEQTKLQLMSSP
jgi:hypothetical protein